MIESNNDAPAWTDDFGPGVKPDWNADFAAGLVGKRVLIGITYLRRDGSFHSQDQMHGVVNAANAKDGFAVTLQGARAGEVYWLPPDQRPFQTAAPGEYRLRATGEVVVDPDFTATWTITRPD